MQIKITTSDGKINYYFLNDVLMNDLKILIPYGFIKFYIKMDAKSAKKFSKNIIDKDLKKVFDYAIKKDLIITMESENDDNANIWRCTLFGF